MIKKLILIIALLLSLGANAQTSFPYKRPELLLGKTVTVMPIGQYNFSQLYQNFYAGKSFSAYYKGKREIPKEMLEGRKFNVAAVEQNRTEKDYEDYWITLKDTAAGETLYYLYSKSRKKRGEYYFEVEGGLDLPADFYCDYIEKMEMPDGTNRYTLNQSVFEVVRSGPKAKPYYTLSLQFFKDTSLKLGPLTIVMEDGSKLVIKGTGTYVVSGRSYVGGEVTAKQLEALSKSKPVSFEYDGKSQLLLIGGDILQKGSACLLTLD